MWDRKNAKKCIFLWRLKVGFLKWISKWEYCLINVAGRVRILFLVLSPMFGNTPQLLTHKPSLPSSEVSFHVPWASLCCHELAQPGTLPRLLPCMHCTRPWWSSSQVVGPPGCGLLLPFHAWPSPLEQRLDHQALVSELCLPGINSSDNNKKLVVCAYWDLNIQRNFKKIFVPV